MQRRCVQTSIGRCRRNSPLRIKYKVWFIIIRKESKHPVHQVRQLLISGERKRDQGLETLIIVQRIKCYKTLSENSIRISSWKGVDQV